MSATACHKIAETYTRAVELIGDALLGALWERGDRLSLGPGSRCLDGGQCGVGLGMGKRLTAAAKGAAASSRVKRMVMMRVDWSRVTR